MNNKNLQRVFMNPATRGKRGMKKKGTRALTLAINTKFCPKSKRSQLTIFIIISIFIIAAIVSFLFLREKVPIKIGGGARAEAPEAFLDLCLEDKIKEGIKIISLQGGYISNPLNKSFKFEGENSPVFVSYLCYNQNDGPPCVNQEPMLIQHLENEIKNYISGDVINCFDDLKESLEKQNYDVGGDGLRGFEVELEPKKIVVDIDAELILTKAEETSKQEEFKVIIASSLYEIANLVIEIINKEVTKCGFTHYDSFLYPEFDINEFPALDLSIIYTIRYEKSNEEFRFAVRGCVSSQGY